MTRSQATESPAPNALRHGVADMLLITVETWNLVRASGVIRWMRVWVLLALGFALAVIGCSGTVSSRSAPSVPKPQTPPPVRPRHLPIVP